MAHEVHLSRPVEGTAPGGSRMTYREHYKALKFQGEEVPELDNPPPIPDVLQHLWSHTMEFRPGELSWQEVYAWTQYTGRKLEPWEVEVMLLLDSMRG